VECAAVDLSKLHGSFTVPTYSGNRRKLEYTKDDFNIAVWHARSFQGFLDGRLGGRAAVCDRFPSHLSAHGRDADSYHVGGSRWFLDEAECERQRAHVLPALVQVVNLEDDGCGRADARLVARPHAELKPGTYFVRPEEGRSCAPVEVVGRERQWPESGYVRMPESPHGSMLKSFTYEIIARGRFLWRSSPDSLDGELLEMKPLKHGVQVGNARWYRNKSSCEAEESR
jgi:hypothetical protein